MSMDQLMALVPIEAATAREPTPGRKSRWERARVRRGKGRFGRSDERPYLPPPFLEAPPGISPNQLDQFLKEQRLEELSLKLALNQLEFGDPDIRAASPPPIYDRLGNRTNTRDVRVRNAMHTEHQSLIEYCVRTVEGYVPPADYKPCKKIRRIMIPQDKYPEYNFMGLIIGPRGCNHKRLEVESGAQISIRGRGTQKEGKKTDQTDEEAAMPQHVHVSADSEEKLEKAVNLIEPLLDPFHPMHEEFKKRGLEQLALVNGVQLAKTEQRCSVCAAAGHLAWECPDMQHQSFKKAEVKCAYCGDMGHVTMDCKIAKERGVTAEELRIQQEGTAPPPPPPIASTGQEAWVVDHEYQRMMSELTGQPVVDQLDQIPGMSPGTVPPPPPLDPPTGSSVSAGVVGQTAAATAEGQQQPNATPVAGAGVWGAGNVGVQQQAAMMNPGGSMAAGMDPTAAAVMAQRQYEYLLQAAAASGGYHTGGGHMQGGYGAAATAAQHAAMQQYQHQVAAYWPHLMQQQYANAATTAAQCMQQQHDGTAATTTTTQGAEYDHCNGGGGGGATNGSSSDAAGGGGGGAVNPPPPGELSTASETSSSYTTSASAVGGGGTPAVLARGAVVAGSATSAKSPNPTADAAAMAAQQHSWYPAAAAHTHHQQQQQQQLWHAYYAQLASAAAAAGGGGRGVATADPRQQQMAMWSAMWSAASGGGGSVGHQ